MNQYQTSTTWAEFTDAVPGLVHPQHVAALRDANLATPADLSAEVALLKATKTQHPIRVIVALMRDRGCPLHYEEVEALVAAVTTLPETGPCAHDRIQDLQEEEEEKNAAALDEVAPWLHITIMDQKLAVGGMHAQVMKRWEDVYAKDGAALIRHGGLEYRLGRNSWEKILHTARPF